MNNIASTIALYIEGTRTRHGGAGYIMSVGVLAGNEIEGEMDKSPVSRVATEENPVITLKNAEGYVFYKLWDSSIFPSDDTSSPGRLAIGVTLPSNARLKNGKSAYRLLMDIYNKFLEIGTSKNESGQTLFLDKELDKAEFIRIIEDYPFDTVSIKTEVMRGDSIGELQIPQEKMEDFFRDSQYHEFVNYKAIEITKMGRNFFPALQIPRPVSYEVFVNGLSTGDFLQDYHDTYRPTVKSTDNERYDSMSFTLAELMSATNHTRKNQSETVVVVLDENRRRIDCTLKSRSVSCQKKMKFTDDSDSDAKEFFRKNDKYFSILLDKESFGDKVRPSEAKDAVKRKAVDVFPHQIEGYKFSVAKAEMGTYGDELVVTLKAIGKEVQGKGEKESKKGGKPSLRNLIVGLLIGLALGIGGMFAWNSIKTNKSRKVEVEKAKAAEKEAYDKLAKFPARKERKEIQDQEQAYLDLLQSEDGISAQYKAYLDDFSLENNKDGYDSEHFNEIEGRLKEYKKDSVAYSEFLGNNEEKDKLLAEASHLLGDINQAFDNKDYQRTIELCNDYIIKYNGVSDAMSSDVNGILGEANSKQTEKDDAKNKEAVWNQQTLDEAFDILFNDTNSINFKKWLLETKGGKTNDSRLSSYGIKKKIKDILDSPTELIRFKDNYSRESVTVNDIKNFSISI